MTNKLKEIIEELIKCVSIVKGITPEQDGLTKLLAFNRVEDLGNEAIANGLESKYTMIDVDCGYTNGGGWVDAKAAQTFESTMDVLYSNMGWTFNNDKYCKVYISPDRTEFTYNHGMEITGYMSDETKNRIAKYLDNRSMLGNRFENGTRIPDIKTNFGDKFCTQIDVSKLKPIPKTENDFGLRSTRDQIIDYLLDGDDYKENVREIIGLYFDREPSSEAEWHKWFIERN